VSTFTRREFLTLASAGLAAPPRLLYSQDVITRPIVSEDTCPLVPFAPMAKDGFRGQGVLRKPPGNGPLPAIVWIHPGINTVPLRGLQAFARGTNASRFLAAGYVVLMPTYRSRDVDPQSTVSLEDSLAVVDHARALPYVDSESIIVYGCSGGGDLALEVAAATRVCAVVPEEPASMLMAGIFNTKLPKQGDRYTAADGAAIMANPKQYYTPEYQKILQTKIARIQCPILFIQGDVSPVYRFNAEVLLPELRAAGKNLQVITYPGERHCFCFDASGAFPELFPGTKYIPPTPTMALKAFRDIDAFSQRHLKTKPTALDPKMLRQVAV
jgi:dipeptidyl aminopeptidase/acylaminoacyl peptidase